jgi:hypothetical protein
MQDSPETIAIIAALAVLAIAVIAMIVVRTQKARRHAELKRRFGPEYDLAVQQHGSVAAAERELTARLQRVHRRKLRQIPEAERAQFAADWRNVQARFVDDPPGAMASADELVTAVMVARGYENVSFDRRIADLSVDHATIVQHYRAARALAEANEQGRADTEELRQAIVHYRALFAALLDQHEPTTRQLQEARV